MGSRSETDGERRMFASERMTWKYEDDKCLCGLVETEKHVLFECTLWRRKRKMESGCKGLERWNGGMEII